MTPELEQLIFDILTTTMAIIALIFLIVVCYKETKLEKQYLNSLNDNDRLIIARYKDNITIFKKNKKKTTENGNTSTNNNNCN